MTKKIKVAALGDLHVRESSPGFFNELFSKINSKADIFLMCGDLTDLGQPKEAEILFEQLKIFTIPVLGVLGNHDFQSDQADEVKRILIQDNKVIILEDNPTDLLEIGFAGIKGFGGGFNAHMLGAFGEKEIKDFVQESVNQELKLENSLNILKNEKKIVVMHYSPIKETCIGEPEEIHPFLGSSRLEEPINNFNVTAVFHGHSHFGAPQGKTAKGIPVYNASLEVMKRKNPDEPYCLIEI